MHVIQRLLSSTLVVAMPVASVPVFYSKTLETSEKPQELSSITYPPSVNQIMGSDVFLTVSSPKIGRANAELVSETVSIPSKNVSEQKDESNIVPQESSHTVLMQEAGIPSADFSYVNYIVSHESGWRVNAEEPSTHAWGACQALPASKMASAGSDYLTNIVTQLRWCNSYAKARYGGWYQAQQFWQNHHWW